MHSEQAIYSGQLLHLQTRKELNYIFLKIWPNQPRIVKGQDDPIRLTIGGIDTKSDWFCKARQRYIISQ
ncbi:hypothetical protein APR40_13550 [Salegentibacter salarius]|uniref:Uncharacterized protein n=1 Tax=Salegentibacter salarius TaxID=435906 RepID=A0A2N0TTB1_9FLAO|nr:hypothetical protein BHS39_13585 [Salegentibacter salarius]PKD17979.1 hypothetical protein APR40_13550 [Salegentibacter salarius]SLK04024.1 hypothetical protein SAMN05660445_02782 [Salegentibacter salarius]